MKSMKITLTDYKRDKFYVDVAINNNDDISHIKLVFAPPGVYMFLQSIYELGVNEKIDDIDLINNVEIYPLKYDKLLNLIYENLEYIIYIIHKRKNLDRIKALYD